MVECDRGGCCTAPVVAGQAVIDTTAQVGPGEDEKKEEQMQPFKVGMLGRISIACMTATTPIFKSPAFDAVPSLHCYIV